MVTIELANGIYIIDGRKLNCGIQINNQKTKYITLAYSSDLGFYLNMKGVWVLPDKVTEYHSELYEMIDVLAEAQSKLCIC